MKTMASKSSSNKAYFTLRPLLGGGDPRRHQLMAGADIIHIGQTSDCAWRFDNPSDYVDEVYAVIRPGHREGEWVLLPTSEHVGVSVNGSPVHLVHYLRDGDIIAFEGERQDLRFNIRRDCRYSADLGVVYIPLRLSRAIIGWMAAGVAIVIVGVWLLIGNANQRSEEISARLNEIGSSDVFRIMVDTVYLVSNHANADGTVRTDTLKCHAYSPVDGGVVRGTAFIVNDSLLITARHCIEPWLNDPSINAANLPDDLPDGPVRWAFEAETVNQLSGSDSLRVLSHCTIWGGEAGSTAIASYSSEEFVVDRSRDDIVPLGDFSHSSFWRSIGRRGELKSQMLGDIAYVKIKPDEPSILSLATSEQMAGLKRGRTLYYLGYPNYDDDSYAYADGTLQKDYADDEMLSHGGNIGHGYSGGPVVAIDKDQFGNLRLAVVGVISVADSKGIGRAYSVPATEIRDKR